VALVLHETTSPIADGLSPVANPTVVNATEGGCEPYVIERLAAVTVRGARETLKLPAGAEEEVAKLPSAE
jgi:hypothetical protein